MKPVAVHNVAQLSDDQVVDRFVLRTAEFEELCAHLRGDGPSRHALVIAPRGMGKSLLVRRLAIEVKRQLDLDAVWLSVLLPEEIYAVTSVGDLWLAALAALAEQRADAALTRIHDQLITETDPERLQEAARYQLAQAAQRLGRRLLLLVENLDMVLREQMNADEGWTLRHALQTEPDLLLVGTAIASFAAIEDQGEALFGFFHQIPLEPLTTSETRTLWRHETGEDLPGERATPVRVLTGGNPRLTTIMGRFTTRPDLSRLMDDLQLLIDEYTPYFKANIEALPAVERKVFVTLADLWQPSSTAEVAAQARLETRAVSSYLQRLTQRGAVQRVPQSEGPARYELVERLYNLYHLLRQPGQAGRVRALVDLLTHLYVADDLERKVLPHVVADLGRAGWAGHGALGVAIASGLERHVDDAGVWSLRSKTELAEWMERLQHLLPLQRAKLGDGHPETLLTRHSMAHMTDELGDVAGALALYQEVARDRVRALGADHRDTLRSWRGVAYCLGESGDYARALLLAREVAADCARVLGADHRDTLTSRHAVAYLLGLSGDLSGALALFREVAADRARALGRGDPDTLTSGMNAIRLADSIGDAATAMELGSTLLRSSELIERKRRGIEVLVLKALMCTNTDRKAISEQLLGLISEERLQVVLALVDTDPSRLPAELRVLFPSGAEE